MDQYGDDVLSQNGAPIKVGAAGTVPTTALGLFNVTNPSQLGNNNFSGRAAGGRASGAIYSGELEGSGIDPIQTMVRMESALNAYTAGQQTIGTISQTMQESAPKRGAGALMLEGLYSAGAGMEAAQTQLDAVSNNIANEDTPGYQSELVGFHDLSTHRRR